MCYDKSWHIIIGSHKDKLENIMHDMKMHTSKALKKAIRDILKKAENNAFYG